MFKIIKKRKRSQIRIRIPWILDSFPSNRGNQFHGKFIPNSKQSIFFTCDTNNPRRNTITVFVAPDVPNLELDLRKMYKTSLYIPQLIHLFTPPLTQLSVSKIRVYAKAPQTRLPQNFLIIRCRLGKLSVANTNRPMEYGGSEEESRKWWMALTGARMIRRKVILLVVRQSSFPLNSLLFAPVPILRATEPVLPHYPSRRSPLYELTTDISRKMRKLTRREGTS